jgi:hypothetical protein
MKIYTEIFHIAPSFQCKMNLERSMSTREVDGLSLIFIDFYVPALTPRLRGGYTALQLSENITFFAICWIYTYVIGKED